MLRGTCSVDGNSDMRPMRYPPQLCAERRLCTDAARGFTLVELLVVVAVIGVLVALLLPAVQAARESSRRTRCANNLRQQGVALINFESQRRSLPVGCIGCQSMFDAPQRYHSWNSQLLPWLEQGVLHQRLDFATPSYMAPNISAGTLVLDVFLCPSTLEREATNTTGLWKTAAFTDYGGVYGVEGVGRDTLEEGNSQHLELASLGVMVYDEAIAFQDILDGLSNTAVVAELNLRRQAECEWINGQNTFAQEQATPINGTSGTRYDVGSPHPGGAQVVFSDGHVEFLSEAMEQETLNALLTRAGEETQRD
jgi:prepilin-type N-terminal cleavage/methylation domain-containing protein/prepilin-type processing-associated H-X9-DG protein